MVGCKTLTIWNRMMLFKQKFVVDRLNYNWDTPVISFSCCLLSAIWLNSLESKANPVPAHRARAPLFEIFKRFIFEYFDSIILINFIVINMQCLQCVFSYFLLYSHQKSIGYVWRGIKSISRAPKLYRAGTEPSGSKIPWSATENKRAHASAEG